MSALAKGPLTVAETEFLGQCEERISDGLRTFMEVGQALAAVRDNRLYRAEFDTFDSYCAARWGISDRRARQMIDAAEVGTMVPVENERQARELARVPADQREAVWEKAVDATEGKPTAAAVREAAAEVARPRATPTTTDQPAATPAEAADPAPAAADGAGPHPVPSAPSPLEKYIAADPTLQRTGWQKNFASALAKSIGIVSFTPEQVAEYSDRQLVDELRRLVTNLDNYATRAEKAWNERNGGLRMIKGGAA